MPFVIDDIAVAATEMSEVAAETAEIAGDVTVSSEIIGDGRVEEALANEKATDVSEASDLSVPESDEIIGDSVGESSIDDSPNLDEQTKTGTEDMGSVTDNSQTDGTTINDVEDDTDSFLNELEQTEVDDNDNPYIKDGDLIPNNEYDFNGYHYTTDDKGRIIKVERKINIPEEKKPRGNLPAIKDSQPGDDKGHLIAHEFDGVDNEGNLVPMNSDLNRNGDYRKFEREIEKAKRDGKDVNVSIEIDYYDNSSRPTSFTVTIEFDGEISERTFLNK